MKRSICLQQKSPSKFGINFVHRFIPNYAEIAKPIYKLLKKDVKLEWDEQGKKAFKEIKDAIFKAPVLVSPDYFKDFKIFSFASEDTIAVVLLQTNDQGQDQPIACVSPTSFRIEISYTRKASICFGYVP